MAVQAEEVSVGFAGLLQVLGLLGPVTLGVAAALAPYLYVRMVRRQRETTMDKELAITLELLATLAEAGYGFDAGIATIHESDLRTSPLQAEFDVYRRDVLAGVSRNAALRQLSERCDMPAISSFVGSLIQADLAGASVADALRRQSDDLRDRRKMQALIHSQALPVKLVFPLLACFLPGLFVATLGPALHQLVKVVDGALRQGR
jgi:tight adherence protein C